MQLKDIRANPLADGSCLLQATVRVENQAIQQLLTDIGTNYHEWELTIVKVRKKRTLDSNAYCWLLINKIADILRTSKETVYLDMLKNYGQSTIISVLADIEVKGFFKYYEVFGTGTVNGKQFTHYKVFKGSSEFDTREMAILIDGVVSEAQGLGIDVRTPAEIERMKSLWGKEEKNGG